MLSKVIKLEDPILKSLIRKYNKLHSETWDKDYKPKNSPSKHYHNCLELEKILKEIGQYDLDKISKERNKKTGREAYKASWDI